MNLRGPFLRARFLASIIVGLAYVLALLYVGSRYPFLVGMAVYVATVAAAPYIVRYLRRRSRDGLR
jgi:predicted PurR-regulated permease PerM